MLVAEASWERFGGSDSGPSTVAGASADGALLETPSCLLTVTLYSPAGVPGTNPEVVWFPIVNLP